MKPTVIAIAALIVASAAGAQDVGGKPLPRKTVAAPVWQVVPQPDPFSACFFSPEAVMAHQAEIKLQDDQRLKLAMQIARTQEAVTSLQWQLSAEQEKLHKAVMPATVDESATLKQVDRILAIEQEVKRAQMTLMIRVKNTLTAEQQRQLRMQQGFVWTVGPAVPGYTRLNAYDSASTKFVFRGDTGIWFYRGDSAGSKLYGGHVFWLAPDSGKRRLVRVAGGC